MKTATQKSPASLRILRRPETDFPFHLAKIASDGGPYTLRGSTPHFEVYYETSVGSNGPTLADAVLATCEVEYQKLQTYFGQLAPKGLPFKVYIVSGVGGAYHATCLATELHCVADSTTTAETIRMLVVAEEDEVFMANQGHWNCGASTGEGLSRVLATELHPSALDGYTSAASWLDAPERPDYISVTDPTDGNYLSIGCSVLFLNWMRYQLGYGWDQIIAAGAATLSSIYTKLTGGLDAVTRFKATMKAAFPEGQISGLSNDNPFPVSTQKNWRWCKKCQGLTFAGNPSLGSCPAGGNHDHAGSGNYSLQLNFTLPPLQYDWRWCNKCQGLCFGGNPNAGACAAGGSHDHTGSGFYTLAFSGNGVAGQSSWKWCQKCQSMTFAGNPSAGSCPAGGSHDHTGSGNYTLPLNAAADIGQANWKWCNKCQGMTFAGNSSLGPCSGGGHHDHTGSGNYSLPQTPPPPLQSNWRWCKKCQGLAFAGNPSPGACPAGGNHDHAGSGNYALIQNTAPIGQDNWRWCKKCQGLAFAGNVNPGSCPAGGNHDHTGSGNYSLHQG